MFHYEAYGLHLTSNVEIPALNIPPNVPDSPDIRITVHHDDGIRNLKKKHFLITPSSCIIEWKKTARCVISRGSQIDLFLPHRHNRAAAVDVITHQAFGLLLQQRGLAVLHGSAVLLRSENLAQAGAVVFVGSTGAGKSTTAAALQRRGHIALADDVAALELIQPQIKVHPAFPQLRLLEEAYTALGYNSDSGVETYEGSGKFAHRAAEHFPAAPQPVRAVYILESGDRMSVEMLRKSDALVALCAYSFLSLMLGAFEAPLQDAQSVLARDWKAFAPVAQRIPVRRLYRPGDLARLDDLAKFIEDDIASL